MKGQQPDPKVGTRSSDGELLPQKISFVQLQVAGFKPSNLYEDQDLKGTCYNWGRK